MAIGVLGSGETPVPIPSTDDGQTPVAHRRVLTFLSSVRAVYLGNACLTEEGSIYLNVPFRFPTVAESALTAELDAPADVRPLRAHSTRKRRS